MGIRSFRDLDAWTAAMDLACAAYDIAERLPPTERFELASQIRRAAVSIPSNIAEGHACGLRNRYRNHVRIAAGSLGELATQVEIASARAMSTWRLPPPSRRHSRAPDNSCTASCGASDSKPRERARRAHSR